jgi:hypothetical protein
MELSKQFSITRNPGDNPDQLTLPGVDLDKAEKDFRISTIKENYLYGDRFNSLYRNQLGKAMSRELFHDNLNMSRGKRSSFSEPTNDVVNMLRLSDMPVTDLQRAGSVVVSDSGKGFFSSLTKGVGGTHDITSGEVTYKSSLPMESRRAVMVHELAHVLQHDLSQSQLELELHKVHRRIWENDANAPDLEAPKSMDGGIGVLFTNPDRSAIRKSGRKNLSRYAHFDTGRYRELEAPSIHFNATPITEGSAEGYRTKYQGKGNFNTMYSPDFFRSVGGDDAAQAYQTAFDYSHQTGKVVPASLILEATRLAGTLRDDLNLEGKRNPRRDTSAIHRMTTHLLQKEMGHTDLPHETEYQNRIKAVEGDHIQQSLFPDIAPDIDRFGNPAGAPIARSPRGEALLAGARTEVPFEHTIERQARNQHVLARERYVNKRGMSVVKDPHGGKTRFKYEDTRGEDLRDRLKAHTAEKAKRDEIAGMSQSGELHPEISKWIDKLVYDKKIEYAKAYGLARQSGAQLPELPKGFKEEHAEATRSKIDQIIAKHGIVK